MATPLQRTAKTLYNRRHTFTLLNRINSDNSFCRREAELHCFSQKYQPGYKNVILFNKSTMQDLFPIRRKSEISTPIPPAQDLSSAIPEPPSIPFSTAIDHLNSLGEPTFSSLGLASYWPPGLIQQLLEFLHVQTALPWWAAFTVFAVGFRVVLLPLQVFVMKQTIPQQNILPKYMELHSELSKALARNETMDAAVISQKLQKFEKEHKPRPWKQMIGLAYQVPVFLSALSGIRGMCNLPVESLKSGGILWFPDLSVADPYFLLPVMTGGALLLSMELGGEGMRTKSLSNNAKYMVRGFCGVLIPLAMMWQPSALGVYWFISNLSAITIVRLLKVPSVKTALGIPDLVLPDQPSRKTDEGFVNKTKRSIKEKQIEKFVSQREGINAKAFADAGRSAPIKTYKYDPTKSKVITKDL